jgi:ATP-dependent DNA helicase DinG
VEKYIIADLETTGHSPSKDKIIEAGIVVVENDAITGDYSALFNPSRTIPPFISNLTGIQDNDVKDAPAFKEKAPEIANMFTDGYFVAHNVSFDLSFLNAELTGNNFKPLTNPVIDTVELARILYPEAPGYKLGQLADYLGIDHDEPHRALSDAYVTAKVFIRLKEKLGSLPYETIAHLIRLESNLKSDLYLLLEQHLQNKAFSIPEKTDITSYRGIAFKVIESESAGHGGLMTSFGEFLDDIYEINGKMQKQIPNYEKRNGQREMSEHIFDAFSSRKHALIEAETGTGKSLAYLLPAVYEAVKTQKRVVISTYTTQLQAQLLDEEIPLIRRLIPFSFKAALLKGKHHYLSLEKFENELHSHFNDNYDVTLTKAKLLVWITETDTGDIDEIQLPSSGYFFYKRISADSEGYVDPSSPWFTRSYYQKARNKAQQADIIITNHALLCTDIFNDSQFLPGYQKAVIDEAHHLENTASRHYGLQLDYIKIQYTLNQIGNAEDGKWLTSFLRTYPEAMDVFPLEKWSDTFSQTKYEVDDLFRALYRYVTGQRKNEKSMSDIGRVQYRFDENKENPKKWRVIKEMSARLTFYLRDLIHLLSLLDQYMYGSETVEKYAKDDLTGHIKELQTFIDHLEHFFLTDITPEQIRWVEMETSGTKNAVYLYSEPSEVAALLTNEFFNKKESIVLTSATLTMRSSFDFIQHRLGLTDDQLTTKKINSPFAYENQVQLMIPDDFPDIKYGDLEEFISATGEAILSLAEITKGRMLVLFTSYDMLRRTHALLKEIMDLNQYMLIAQGISSGSRAKLKKNFQTFDKAVLLGTSSFWEGVDIPGEDLSCVMIVRLPFQPPHHPVYEARTNYYKQQGKNAFFELSLPNAVIRFKQGFGRLIRSTSDRGIVFVCDARIKKTRYGKFFTESIPKVPITYGSTSELMRKAEKWF